MTGDRVAEPGIYPDMAEDTYHGDPVEGGSLSSTGVRLILDSPARFAWRRDHPEHRAVFDFGSAAHKLALGAGPDLAVIDADDWRTKAAKEAREAAYAAGQTPLLQADYERVTAMRDALMAHPLASAALDAARGGKPEQSLFCRDDDSGVWLRARLDWMPDPHSAMRPVIFDYKTTVSAKPDVFARSMASYGYHVQASFYEAIYTRLTGVTAPLVFIAQEKEPPYLVSVCKPDDEALAEGASRIRDAIELYASCAAVDEWPGYHPDIHYLSLPRWARQREDYE